MSIAFEVRSDRDIGAISVQLELALVLDLIGIAVRFFGGCARDSVLG
jgi:hypothetical protein